MKLMYFIVFGLLSFSLNSQTIFDIEVDQVYFDNDNITFLNIQDSNYYNCAIVPTKISEFGFQLSLDCEEGNEWWWHEWDTIRIEFEDIYEFNEPKQLLSWIENLKFAKETNATNLKHNAYLQFFNNNFFTFLHYKNIDEVKHKWEFYEIDFCDYVFIRINKKYLIIALVYESDASIAGYIVPTYKNAIVVSQNYQYYEHGSSINEEKIEQHINMNSFYRKIKSSNQVELYDKLFNEKILEDSYDDIIIGENYLILKQKNGYTIKDKSASKIVAKNIETLTDSLGVIKCVIKNEIKWLDKNGEFHSSFPK